MALDLKREVFGEGSPEPEPPAVASDGDSAESDEVDFATVTEDVTAELHSTEPNYDYLWRQFRPFIDRFGSKAASSLLTEFKATRLNDVVASGDGEQFAVRMRGIILAANEAETETAGG